MKKDEKEKKVSLPLTLRALQAMRTEKGGTDKTVHVLLDNALKECTKVDMVLMLERIMLHIGDISRQHNLLSELGIKSASGGAQERKTFRSILRWWEKNLPESFVKNLRVIVEFTVLENLMFYQNTTDRYKGKVLNTEMLFPQSEVVYEFLATQIRKGKNTNLIAKHLPKYATGKFRTAKKKIKARTGVESFNWTRPTNAAWVKLNGILVDTEKIRVKTGDVVSYPRAKQKVTLDKEAFINNWIKNFCKVMDWTITEYKTFRSTQHTAEQKISTTAILAMPKSDFMEFLDGLTTGQRFRVSKTVCYKEKGADKLTAKEKWGKLGGYFIEWETGQEKVADKLREAASTNDTVAKAKLMKQFKVKSTGIQTIDLVAKLFECGTTAQIINNTYQSMVEKMDLIANVFPIIDGSGSMMSSIVHGWGADTNIDEKYKNITAWQVACALCVTFSSRNPNMAFRNTFGWFSNDFKIIGKSKFVNDAPNAFVAKSSFTKKVNEYNILSEKATFVDNFNALSKANPGHIASTNMFASIDYFVKLVQNGAAHAEDLPVSLLYITDNENNTGKSPKQAMELAATIGWHPLLIFWGIRRLPADLIRQTKGLNNILFVGGFSESVLSQILRGIKHGTVNPEDELWSIFDDKRYSVIK